jgi:hypothetical protein
MVKTLTPPTCDGSQVTPYPSSYLKVPKPKPIGEPKPKPKPSPKPEPTQEPEPEDEPYYRNCDAVRCASSGWQDFSCLARALV